MNENKMNRGLKNRHLQLISLGGVIGSGYFLGTGYVLEKAGPASILAYLLGGVIVLCVMLCLAELAVEKPVSGSFVMYAKENISSTWACGVGCMGCHLCEKNSGGKEANHFTFQGFLAKVNYENPPTDEQIVAKCPAGCMSVDPHWGTGE